MWTLKGQNEARDRMALRAQRRDTVAEAMDEGRRALGMEVLSLLEAVDKAETRIMRATMRGNDNSKGWQGRVSQDKERIAGYQQRVAYLQTNAADDLFIAAYYNWHIAQNDATEAALNVCAEWPLVSGDGE